MENDGGIVIGANGQEQRVPFAHDEGACALCQKDSHLVSTTTVDERQAYRRSLRGLGFQTHTMHNYEVQGLGGLLSS